MNASTKQIIRSVKDPQDGYRPVMMWFWNGPVTKAGIAEELTLMKEQRITDFFIHPAEGMELEYLSDEYMEMVAFAVEFAKANGMYYWIYDEYNWPSGVAGEKLLIDHPEYHCRLLAEKTARVQAGALGILPVEIFLGAQYVPVGDPGAPAVDITDECQLLGGKCFWKNTTGADVVFRVQSSSHQDRVWPFAAGCRSSKMTPGYVDLTNPDATRCFIEYTHDRYKQYIGAEFGRTVRGVFTDEPGFMWQAYPVSDHLIAGLARKYGPDVPRLLYLLFAENDGRAAAFRRDYYEVLHRLMIDSFLSVNIQWCEANNLLFTGHINGEESLACNLNDGETLPRLRGFGIPGVDLIWITVRMFWPDFDTLCATIANITHFSGKERMLCETYTLSTWSLTMQHMRRVASRLLPSGVNMMQYMGCHYTFAGIKTTHAGPDNGVYNVLFPYCHIFSDYVSRLSGLSAETVPQAKVAVLQPLTAGYEHTVNYEYPEREGHAHISRSHFKQIMNTYDSVINSLSRHNIGFELLYESQLLEDGVSVCDGKLCVPNPAPIRETAAPNTYEVVILPMARCTQGKTRKLLEQFVREGGRLILAGDVPAWDIDDFVPYNLGDLAAAAEEAAALRRGEWAQKQTRCLFPAPGVQVILSNELGLAESGFRDAVKAGIAAAGVVDDLEVEAPEGIFSIRRRDAEGVRYFFLTNNRTEPASAQVRVRTGQPSLLLDVENSTVIRSLEAADCLTLPPCVCQVIVSAPQEQLDQFLAAFPPAPVYAKAEDIPLASFSFRACGPNTRRLDFGLYKDAAALSGADGQTIWNTVSQAPAEAFTKDLTFPDNSLYAARASFRIQDIPARLMLVTEQLYGQRIFCNGCELGGSRQYLDKEEPYAAYDITALVRIGENTVVATGRSDTIVRSYAAPFVRLEGDFLLSDANELTAPHAVTCVGDWTQMGYPQYGGTGSYEIEIDCRESAPSAIRFATGDTVALLVDGQPVGTKIGEPYIFPLEGLAGGVHTLRADVTGTLHNLYFGTAAPRGKDQLNGGTLPSGITRVELLY